MIEVERAPDLLQAMLAARGVGVRRPVHRPAHRALGLDGFPEADRLWAPALSVLVNFNFSRGLEGVVVGATIVVARDWLAYTGKKHIHHRFEAPGWNRAQSVLLILFIAGPLGLSAIRLRQATSHEAALILVQAGCVLTIIAILESVGRGRPGRS